MRSFVVALAILGMFATVVKAADDDSSSSPVAGKLPDTSDNLSVYLFTLKKNDLSLKMSPQDFCTKMKYGEAVLGHQPDEIGEDGKAVSPGKLDWVICRYKAK
jgi:hypothetical protein